ncbi:hypothetical protein AADZ91_00155 [Colwelliaceae bacterium 6441]
MKIKVPLPILLSVSLHLLLFLFIYLQSKELNTPKLIETKVKKVTAIKSFIYHKPTEKSNDSNISQSAKYLTQKLDDVLSEKQKVAIDTPLPKKSLNNKLVIKKVNTQTAKQTKVEKDQLKKVRPKQTLPSAQRQLLTLKKKMDEQSIDAFLAERQEALTLKILKGTAPTVPHSVLVETIDEQIKKTSSSMSYYADATIFKDDDGICTQIRDLSKVGMEGLTEFKRTQCGLSKFDKSFKSHMTEVINRIKVKR